MKKQLNISAITNELRGNSAFFPRYKEARKLEPATDGQAGLVTPEVPATATKPTSASHLLQSKQAAQPQRRSFVRRSFDFYEDQIAYLTKVSLEERLAGKDSSMNAMLREAVDDYIKKRTGEK
jgi:hypothetical protein